MSQQAINLPAVRETEETLVQSLGQEDSLEKADGSPLQYSWLVSLLAQMVKNRPAPGFNPWVTRMPWRREWLPTPIFKSEVSHGRRELAGHSPWGHKESDMTEWLTHHPHCSKSFHIWFKSHKKSCEKSTIFPFYRSENESTIDLICHAPTMVHGREKEVR